MNLNNKCVLSLFPLLALTAMSAAGCGSSSPAPAQVAPVAAQPAMAATCQNTPIPAEQAIRLGMSEFEVVDGGAGVYRLVSTSILVTTFGNPTTYVVPGATTPAPAPIAPTQLQAPSYINFQATVSRGGHRLSTYSILQACQGGTRDAFGTGYLSIAIPEVIHRRDGTVVTKALTFQMGPMGPIDQSVMPMPRIDSLSSFEMRSRGQTHFYRGVKSGIDLVTESTRDLGLWPMTVTTTFHYEFDPGRTHF